MISRRYAAPLMGCLLLALVPTVLHGYLRRSHAIARITDASLPSAVADVAGEPRTRTGGWIADTYGVESWAERTYPRAGQGEVGLFVTRGFDMKKLYHHPELGVLRGNVFAAQQTQALPGGGDGEWVHVLRHESAGPSVVYALVYDGRWVANPYRLQLSSALTSLWTGPRPLLLVFAYGDVLTDGRPSPFTADLLRAAVARLAETGDGPP